MTYDAARPRYTLTLDGRDYELVGTFELIEAIEHAMQQGIVQVAKRVMDMGLADTARLVAACTGQERTAVGEVLYGLGLESPAYAVLKLHLFAFLRIMLAPQEDREVAADKLGKLIGEASPGVSTSASV